MRCFYHPVAEAVGICKNCSRALCSECAGTGTGSLACPNRCERAVDAIDTLVARNIRLSRGTPGLNGLAILTYFGASSVLGYLFFRENNVTMRVMFGVMMSVMLLAGFANARALFSRTRNRS